MSNFGTQHAEVSFFKSCTQPANPDTVTLDELAADIIKGRWKNEVEELRALTDEEAAKRHKRSKLPAFTPAGTFTYRKAEDFKAPSGFFVGDLDEVNDPQRVRDMLAADPYVLMAFVSPSGNGVKIIVRVEKITSAQDATSIFKHLRAYYGAKGFQLKLDNSGSDISRLCIVSYDPKLRHNPNPEVFKLEDHPIADAPIHRDAGHDQGVFNTPMVKSEASAQLALQHVRRIIQKVKREHEKDPANSRHRSMLYACKVAWQYVLGGHVGEDEALQALLDEWETMFPSNRERRDDLKRAFKGAREYAERDGALHPSPSGPKSASADDVVGEDLLDKLYEMTFTPRWDNKPDALPDTVTLDGEGIAKAGSLHLIMAGTKQGKSTVCGALYAAAIRPDLDDLNALGFKVNLPDTAPAALYFDTEQEDGETWTAWSRALARAGYKEGDDLPDYVDGTHISLTNISNPLHRQALVLHLMDTVDGLGLVIIDGIGDLITNVNDPEQVDLLMNKLRTTASLRKICLFVTLHTNPKQQPSNGDTKARGHLGSDALRRARSYIRVSKDKVGIHTIAVEGNRAGRDDVKVFFRWSDEHHRHIKCDKDEPVPLTSSDAQLKIILDELMGDTTHLHSVLEKMLMERLGKSDRTCRNKIGFAFAQGWINEPLGRKKGYRFVRSQPEEEPDDMLF